MTDLRKLTVLQLHALRNHIVMSGGPRGELARVNRELEERDPETMRRLRFVAALKGAALPPWHDPDPDAPGRICPNCSEWAEEVREGFCRCETCGWEGRRS